MKRFLFLLLAAICCALDSGISTALAQGTGFTYQGRLSDSNGPVSGNYDFVFTSFTSSNGSEVKTKS
jgi:spermidine/putrescine-binding protein